MGGKPGRPRKPKHLVKGKVIQVRMTRDLYKRVKKAAGHRTASSWLRNLAKKKLR